MACYIIVFQAKLRSSRDALRALMREYGTYCPLTNTCWALVTDETAKGVRDNLKSALVRGDRLFIIRSGTEAAWRNAISSRHSEWLKKNL